MLTSESSHQQNEEAPIDLPISSDEEKSSGKRTSSMIKLIQEMEIIPQMKTFDDAMPRYETSDRMLDQQIPRRLQPIETQETNPFSNQKTSLQKYITSQGGNVSKNQKSVDHRHAQDRGRLSLPGHADLPGSFVGSFLTKPGSFIEQNTTLSTQVTRFDLDKTSQNIYP